MLRNISIDNYALIKHVEIDFTDGLTIITGETGSGKSIILGALGLLTGERADSRVVGRHGAKAIVEAKFDAQTQELKKWFGGNNLDWFDDGVVVRRELGQNGRSRSFINDSPVNLSTLSELMGQLLDINTQHQTRMLNDPKFQLEVIDLFSDNEQTKRRYKEAFSRALELRNKIKSIKKNLDDIVRQKEVLEFKLNALKTLNPRKGELVEIEAKFEVSSRADEIKNRLAELSALFSAPDDGILDSLHKASAMVAKYNIDNIITLVRGKRAQSEMESGFERRLATVLEELNDLSLLADQAKEAIDIDQRELDALSARMNLYYQTIKQFNVIDADELVDLKLETERQLELVELGDDSLLNLESLSREANKDVKQLAELLSETRKKGALEFAEAVENSARPMGLSNLDFSVDFETGKYTSSGQDEVRFMASFNKNQSCAPVDKIASGGELSRLMLAIKSVLAGKMALPTVVFDEIDTGVSGEIADKMGEMMKGMGERMQVLAITHLPQVAAKGDTHYKVYKTDDEDSTQTHVERLSKENRVKEIASMISGQEIGESAVDTARHLLGI